MHGGLPGSGPDGSPPRVEASGRLGSQAMGPGSPVSVPAATHHEQPRPRAGGPGQPHEAQGRRTRSRAAPSVGRNCSDRTSARTACCAPRGWRGVTPILLQRKAAARRCSRNQSAWTSISSFMPSIRSPTSVFVTRAGVASDDVPEAGHGPDRPPLRRAEPVLDVLGRPEPLVEPFPTRRRMAAAPS